jgi:hypothetical protein
MPKAARIKNSVEPGKKVGRHSWTTDAQETWLTDHVKEFVDAQGKGNNGVEVCRAPFVYKLI